MAKKNVANVAAVRAAEKLREAKRYLDMLPQAEVQEMINNMISPGAAVMPDPPVPFRFVASSGQEYSIRLEKKGNGQYWHMRKQVAGRLHNVYLGPVGKVDLPMLENAAKQIEATNE